jgi:DNA modification methylase
MVHSGICSIENDKRVHPTQKPVKLAEWFFERWGKETKLVVDLFLGSGSTLIACEKTGRKCYGMELDPHYCSVIIERWQNFTGKKAQRLDG